MYRLSRVQPDSIVDYTRSQRSLFLQVISSSDTDIDSYVYMILKIFPSCKGFDRLYSFCYYMDKRICSRKH
ncbi:hypothetical protein HMPREF1148_0219 [Selenomonas sp. FOBRC6]|nr:hypothetical protein HMPREF1148_0219 [Selenomonas sp. FOBRC6]